MMSDDDTDLLCKAFPIDILAKGEEFDLDIPPTSGQEYLRRVHREAKKCPSVVVADLDTSSYMEKQTFKVPGISGLHPAPSGYSPSIRWQREHMAKFSSVRQKFSRHKAEMKNKHNKGEQSRRLPDKNDVQAWCHLCFGQLSAYRVPPPQPPPPAPDVATSNPIDMDVQEDGQSQGNTSGTVSEPPQNGIRGKPPLLSIVANMDQPTVVQVLEYHVNWFEATGFTQIQGQWFYALLTSLEKPLDPETCSLLRSLAKNCANLRAALESSSDLRLAPLNLLICLVARYFDQTDLADNR